MKFNALVLTAAGVIFVGITATQAAPIVRDHRTVDSSTCPGGVAVNGKCAKTVKPPRCGHGYGYGYYNQYKRCRRY